MAAVSMASAKVRYAPLAGIQLMPSRPLTACNLRKLNGPDGRKAAAQDDKTPIMDSPARATAMSAFHLWTPLKTQAVFRLALTRSRMLPSVRPLGAAIERCGPVWEFADRIPHHPKRADKARWKALVFPIPSRRLLRHTLLRPTASSDDLASANG